MSRYFTEEENLAFYAAQPTKGVGVMVAYTDPQGHVLVVKPNYKPGWNLVGGYVDHNEAPLDAAIRETTEEIGLEVEPGRLQFVGVHYLPPAKYPDFVRLMFTASLSAGEVAAISIADDELDEYKFVTLDELSQLTERPVTVAMHAILTSRRGCGYVEGRQLKGLDGHEASVAMTSIVAGVLIERDGKFLLIQEAQAKARGQWNLPAGRVDLGESITEAAAREASEETGYQVTVGRELSVLHPSAARPVFHVFTATIAGGQLSLPPGEIMDSGWFTPAELRAMADQLRYPDLVLKPLKALGL